MKVATPEERHELKREFMTKFRNADRDASQEKRKAIRAIKDEIMGGI
jgi:hypothetical protein